MQDCLDSLKQGLALERTTGSRIFYQDRCCNGDCSAYVYCCVWSFYLSQPGAVDRSGVGAPNRDGPALTGGAADEAQEKTLQEKALVRLRVRANGVWP